jgi:hypothetical protein
VIACRCAIAHMCTIENLVIFMCVCKFPRLIREAAGVFLKIYNGSISKRWDFDLPALNILDAGIHESVGCIRYDAMVIIYSICSLI